MKQFDYNLFTILVFLPVYLPANTPMLMLYSPATLSSSGDNLDTFHEINKELLIVPTFSK